MHRPSIPYRSACAFLIAVIVTAAANGQSPNGPDVSDENSRLRERVGSLEAEVRELRTVVQDLRSVQANSITQAKDGAELEKAVRDISGKMSAPSVTSALAVEIYGFLKMDMSYDTQHLNEGNFGRWVEPESDEGEDNEFNLTPRHSRLGINVSGPKTEGMKTSGKLEIDFYNGGAENKALPQIRHAYANIEWPEADFGILAGQTWDIVSPMTGPTPNASVLGFQGDVGTRNPQLRFTKGFELADKTKLSLIAGFSRTIGDAVTPPGDTGEDSGFPTIQGRATLQFPGFGSRPATAGIYGLWGKEEDVGAARDDFDVWLVGAYFDLKFTDWLQLRTDGHWGANIDAYQGGINQGVMAGGVVESNGGWSAFSFGPFSDFTINVGFGIENPADEDLADGGRKLNWTAFANVFYNLSAAVTIAFEVAWLETDYLGKNDGEAARFQLSVIYNF